ncbi:MAG: hypothetical protein RMK52_01160 [Chitinophagales bacterium]|nr:hypothetical protein [Chitinophagales bacterium]MDW8392834.1 hypothetical protein [Chitinophagales bacterium]
MKKILFLAFILLFSFKIDAQTEKASIVQYAPSIYVELFGPSILYAVNYDQRIAPRRDGLGIRGGIGYVNLDDFRMLVVPIGMNYLIGKENRYLELGLGATFMDLSDEYLFMNLQTILPAPCILDIAYSLRMAALISDSVFRRCLLGSISSRFGAVSASDIVGSS